MKRIFSFVLILGSVAVVAAQERVLSKAEFDAVVNDGYGHKEKWKGEKYRLTVTTSSTVAGRPHTDFSSKNITEFGPSGETRTISSSVFGGKASVPTETLRIGEWLYTRSGDEAWARKDYVASNTAAKDKEETPRKILNSEAEYKYLGQVSTGDNILHVYVKTERQTAFNEKTSETSETESKNVYWVNPKGIVLKNEYTSQHRGKNSMQTSLTMEWELDPLIAFEVPAVIR
jgi:hypothetical protein